MKQHLQSYLFAFRIVWQSSACWTIAQFVLILIQAIVPVGILYFLKLIYNTLINSQEALAENFDSIVTNLIYLGVITLLNALALLFSQLVNEAQQQKVSDYVAGLIQDQTMKLDLSYFEDPTYHNTYFKVQKEAISRPTEMILSLNEMLQNGLSFLIIAGFISSIHLGGALLLILSVTPAIVIRYYYSQKFFEWQKKRTQTERKSSYLFEVLSSISFVKEMRIYGMGSTLKRKFKEIRKQLLHERLGIAKLRVRNTMIAKLFEVLAEVILYVYIIKRALEGNTEISDAIILFQAFARGKSHLIKSLQSFVKLSEHRMFLSYLNDFLKFESTIKDENNSVSPKPIENLGIELQQVSFQYPQQSQWALKEVNLTLQPGKVYAIVGENGSGKSSLIKLLCRLYDPTEGRVLVEGEDLKSVKVSDFHKQVSAVFQDFAQYHFTLAQNIDLNIEKEVPEVAINKALEAAGAKSLIDQLRSGLHQSLGKEFEQGTELSLGQWQKIAIARALYKPSGLLILDEPTSAIDALSESKIFESIRDEAKGKGKGKGKGKIVILVTHRLYNLKMADKVIVMHQGIVEEQGTHTELLEKKGPYFKMFKKQSNALDQ